MIAFLGMGLLGSNFVRKLIERGETVHVWNRTPQRARALESEGAHAFDDPAAAVRGAARVHVTVSEDAAVDDLLERARPGFAEGVILVDHSTTSPPGTAARFARWRDRGIRFQHAPVFMGPQNARDATGTMLASGDRATFESVESALAKMTGKLLYLGPQPERAAACKLLGNMFLMFVTVGLADALAFATGEGVPYDQVRQLLEAFNPAAQVGARLQRILDGDFGNPSWELVMARKDARLILEASETLNAPLAVFPSIAALMDRWLASGHAHDDWMVVARDSVRRG
jgi:3-hydroxyisobutyrate dehydrogenase